MAQLFRNQKAILEDSLAHYSAVSLEALAARLGMNEDHVFTMLHRDNVPMHYKGGRLWVIGRAPRRTLKHDKGDV